jgi:hypothetical protein
MTMEIIKEQLEEMTGKLADEMGKADNITEALMEAGAPYIEGTMMPKH